VADHQEVVSRAAEATLRLGPCRDALKTDWLADPFGFQVCEPARPEEVYVGACGTGAYCDRPKPSFDPAVSAWGKGVATWEVADADEHYASGVPSAQIRRKPR
jgi:hypothetical protein